MTFLVFLSIMGFGAIVTVVSALLGHDHDHDLGGHDFGGHDHDGHDHDSGHDNQAVVSIFSTKVMGMFVTGFGCGGAIARYSGWTSVQSSLAGLGVGVVIAGLAYLFLRALYGHQANSLVYSSELVNQQGVVMTQIDTGSVGEINVSLGQQNMTYLARDSKGGAIPKGKSVKVVASQGSELLVEEVN